MVGFFHQAVGVCVCSSEGVTGAFYSSWAGVEQGCCPTHVNGDEDDDANFIEGDAERPRMTTIVCIAVVF